MAFDPLKNSKIESFSYYFSRFSFYCDAKFLLVSRFSGFLEPEMQVLVVTYVAFMFSSSIFFSLLVEITLARLFASCRQTVWQVLLEPPKLNTHDDAHADASL